MKKLFLAAALVASCGAQASASYECDANEGDWGLSSRFEVSSDAFSSDRVDLAGREFNIDYYSEHGGDFVVKASAYGNMDGDRVFIQLDTFSHGASDNDVNVSVAEFDHNGLANAYTINYKSCVRK